MERNIRVRRMVNPTYAEVHQKLTILVIEVTKREREEQAKQCKRSLAKRSSSVRFASAQRFFSLSPRYHGEHSDG
jgi:hypothetical protein